MNDYIFHDDTNSHQDDDVDDDDIDKNVRKTSSTSHPEDEDIEACLKTFEKTVEIVDWDPEKSSQKENFTQETKYRSEDSFL